VFRDIGLENPDLLLAKSTIIGDIHAFVNDHEMTFEDAAKRIGITTDDLDQIIRGDLDRYSKRELKRFLGELRNHANASKNGMSKTRKTSKIKR